MSSSKEIDHDQDLCHVCWAKFIEHCKKWHFQKNLNITDKDFGFI